MLVEHGGLDRLALARAEELAALPGVGPTKAAALVAAFQLSRNLGGDLLPDTVRRPDDLAAIAQQELAGLRRERVLVLVLDAGNRVQRVVALTDGSIDRSLLPVREVLNAVLRNDGAAFALAHNHPSGDLTPSRSPDRDRLGLDQPDSSPAGVTGYSRPSIAAPMIEGSSALNVASKLRVASSS